MRPLNTQINLPMMLPMLSTLGGPAIGVVFKDFSGPAAGLFGNMRVPAALVAGAVHSSSTVQHTKHVREPTESAQQPARPRHS